jgi:hypothetical protein
VQASYLKQLEDLQTKCNGVPILCAGDVLDHWDSPPELINFAIEHLPPYLHAVPGQHDLPNHSPEQIKRSAYWTLVEAGKIINLACQRMNIGRVRVFPFRWGKEVYPRRGGEEPDRLDVALIHSYIWSRGHRHGGLNPDKPNEQHLTRWLPKLKGYDVALFGDNHKGFKAHPYGGRLVVYNNGTFIRRHSDERGFAPRVGIIYADSYVQEHHLDTSQDVFVDDPAEEVTPGVSGLDAGELLEIIRKQGDATIQFTEAVRHYLREQAGLTAGARKLITELLEKARAHSH